MQRTRWFFSSITFGAAALVAGAACSSGSSTTASSTTASSTTAGSSAGRSSTSSVGEHESTSSGSASSIGSADSSSSTGSGVSANSTSSGTSTSSTSSGTSASSSSGSGGACALKASCDAADKTCVGLVSNAGLTKFGLRMSELDLTAPAALSTGLVANIVGGAAGLADPSCNQGGTGLLSWLLQFDTSAMTLKTGGARPVSDPTQGYSFDTETIGTAAVAPVTFTNVTPDASGNFAITTGQNVVIPVFLNAAGTSTVLLSLHQARITHGTLSSSNDCIGSYNAEGLSPTNSCLPSTAPPVTGFIDAGAVDGYMVLKEADQDLITAINETLCVLLSGNATMYGTVSSEAGGATVCKRDAMGNIVFQGDWCAATNAAATATCADSMHFAGTFAASSVKILN